MTQIKKTLKENYFETINTQKKAYYLGWMFSDGFLTSSRPRIGLELNIQDVEQVEKFRKDLGIQTKLEHIAAHNSVRTQFTSKKMYSDLIKQGCITNKSLVLQAPTKIPARLISHTIRGYFDGDGCVGFFKKSNGNTQPHVTIIGTLEFITWLQKQINVSSYIYRAGTDTTKNTYRLVISKQAEVAKMRKYLYKDSTISLSRKKQKFQEVVKNLKERK